MVQHKDCIVFLLAKALREELENEREEANEEVPRALSVEEKTLLKRMLREIRG